MYEARVRDYYLQGPTWNINRIIEATLALFLSIKHTGRISATVMSGNKRPAAADTPSLKKQRSLASSADMEIDENLHSRQLAVYGREVMKRMAASAVLISGANGLGVEIGEIAMWILAC